MIITHLRGGVANQMFQFAHGYAQAKRFKTGLILDLTNYKTDSMRKYSLDLFAGIAGRYDKITDSDVDVNEDGMPYNSELMKNSDANTSFKGYWQTEKYFVPYSRELFQIFSPKQPLTPTGRDTLRQIQNCGNRSVFLTIRRTDYVNNDFHGLLPISYYEEALRIIADKVDPYVFIFSDDPEWCKENLNFPYETIIAGNFDRTTHDHLGREDEELYLMRNCAHAVMANSSYSWWGAYMGDNNPYLINGRIVICPKKWFGPKSNEDPRDIPRDNWIQI